MKRIIYSIIRVFPILILILIVSGCYRATIYETPVASGQVIDAQSKEPISGAKVMFKEYPETAGQTDTSGHFKVGIENVKWVLALPYDFFPPPGTLVVEAEGYQTFEKELIEWKFCCETPIELTKTK